MTLLIILAILSTVVFLFLWGCCAVGAKADEQTKRIFDEANNND